MAHLTGRGAASNPTSRFERLRWEPDVDACAAPGADDEEVAPATRVYRDTTRSILSRNDSPDIHFDRSINPYRGCEHGCIYCYARPYHEYLGWSGGLDFETRIVAKHDAPTLLRKELSAPSYRPAPLGLSGATDCYQPIERHLRLTRGCLEVLADFGHPVSVITKNHLVTRDIDLLAHLARVAACEVSISLGTLDDDLARRLEPRASAPRRRLQAIEQLAAAGIPVVVLTSPMISGLNDHELPSILQTASRAGARWAGYSALRLPHGVKGHFTAWLEEHAPLRRDKVLHRFDAMHEQASGFGSRMRGKGFYADELEQLFALSCRRLGLATTRQALSCDAFEVPRPRQLELFDS